jgi:hypothetical protein
LSIFGDGMSLDLKKDNPQYLRITSRFTKPTSDLKSRAKSASDVDDSLSDDSNGLETADRLIEIVRQMLNGRLNDFEDYYGRCHDMVDWIDSINENCKSFLLKEFLVCEEFVERLQKIQSHEFLRYTFSRVFNARTVAKFFMQTKATDDLSDLFKNVLLSSRLLPPTSQEKFFARIGELYVRVKKVAKIHGQPWPKIEAFLGCLFDFNAAPFCYLADKTTQVEHQATFSETMSSLLQVILSSTITLLAGVDSVTALLRVTWDLITSEMPWEVFVEELISKIDKESLQTVEKDDKKDVKSKFKVPTSLTTESNIDSLSTLIYGFYAYKLTGLKFLDVLRVLVAAFKGKRRESSDLKILLTTRLQKIPRDMWTHETLPYVRLMDRSSTKNNMLQVFYENIITHSGYKEVYCPDILGGLKRDAKFWIKILNGFLNSPKSLALPKTVFRPFYAPLKALVASTDPNLDEPFFKTTIRVFLKVLRLTYIDCTNDWEILLKHVSLLRRSDEIVKNLIHINPLPSDEDSISKLLLALLYDGLQNASCVFWLMRLFETSKNPSSLVFKVLDAIGPVLNGNLPSTEETGTFLHFLAEKEQSAAVHERIITLITSRLGKSNFDLKYSFAKLIVFVAEKKLCTSEAYKQINKYAGNNIEDRYHEDRSYCSAVAYLALSPDNTSLMYQSSSFARLAFFIQKHRMNPSMNFDFAKLSKCFKDVVDVVVKKYRKAQVYSLILIDFLKEFDSTPNFDELRKYAISKALEKSTYFLPSYMLSEALRCATAGIDCPKNVRHFLLNVKKWYKMDERAPYFLRKELEDVLAGTQKLFGTSGSAESDLVRFLASLYFVADINEQFHSVPIFTQLAK